MHDEPKPLLIISSTHPPKPIGLRHSQMRAPASEFNPYTASMRYPGSITIPLGALIMSGLTPSNCSVEYLP